MANVIHTIRDRSNRLWSVAPKFEGRYVATCDYGLGIKGSYSSPSLNSLISLCANAN